MLIDDDTQQETARGQMILKSYRAQNSEHKQEIAGFDDEVNYGYEYCICQQKRRRRVNTLTEKSIQVQDSFYFYSVIRLWKIVQ